MPKMVDLSRTEDERKKLQEASTDPADVDNVPEYEWGTSMCLNTATLEKLGIKGLPAPGTELRITGVAKVTATRMSAGEGENDNKGVDIQMTHMMVEAPEIDKSKAAKAMYPSASDDKSD